MDSEGAKEMLWKSPTRSFWFLVWCGLLSMPAFCPEGHKWKPCCADKGQSQMKCGKLVMKPYNPKRKRKREEEEEDEELEALFLERHGEIFAEKDKGQGALKPGDLKKQPCNLFRTWRQPGTLQV